MVVTLSVRLCTRPGDGRDPVDAALTGWGQDDDRRRSEEAGFDAHLLKPVDEAALGKLLADLGAGKQEALDSAREEVGNARLQSFVT